MNAGAAVLPPQGAFNNIESSKSRPFYKQTLPLGGSSSPLFNTLFGAENRQAKKTKTEFAFLRPKNRLIHLVYFEGQMCVRGGKV